MVYTRYVYNCIVCCLDTDYGLHLEEYRMGIMMTMIMGLYQMAAVRKLESH